MPRGSPAALAREPKQAPLASIRAYPRSETSPAGLHPPLPKIRNKPRWPPAALAREPKHAPRVSSRAYPKSQMSPAGLHPPLPKVPDEPHGSPAALPPLFSLATLLTSVSDSLMQRAVR
jgi:hypothetical protein